MAGEMVNCTFHLAPNKEEHVLVNYSETPKTKAEIESNKNSKSRILNKTNRTYVKKYRRYSKNKIRHFSFLNSYDKE